MNQFPWPITDRDRASTMLRLSAGLDSTNGRTVDVCVMALIRAGNREQYERFLGMTRTQIEAEARMMNEDVCGFGKTYFLKGYKRWS